MSSTLPPGPDAALPPRWRWLRRAAEVALGAVLLLWALLLAAWLLLHWIILPHIGQWRPAIERHASEAVGAKVTIGRIDVRDPDTYNNYVEIGLPSYQLYNSKFLSRVCKT